MMHILKSILASYGINSFLVKDGEMLEIIIMKRDDSFSLERWINMITSIKYKFQKNVDFLLYDDALKIYGSLDSFELLENDYD